MRRLEKNCCLSVQHIGTNDRMIKAKIANIIEEECDNCTIKSVCWNSFSSMVLVGGRCHNKVFLHKGKA